MDVDLEQTRAIEEAVEEAVREAINQEEDATRSKKSPPTLLPIFPLVRRPFFPGIAAPITVEEGPFLDVIKKCLRTEQRHIGLVLTREETANPLKVKLSDLHQIGVMGRILRIIPSADQGNAQIILNAEKRIRILEGTSDRKILKAKVEYLEEKPILTQELKAYSIAIISTIKELLKLNPLFKEELQLFLSHSDFAEPGKLADFATALTTASRMELQEVLETLELPERIDKALILLKKELDLNLLQTNIQKKVESSITKTQREFFLREQLKAVRRELGMERDDKVIEKEKIEARLKERVVPQEVQKVIEEETNKLQVLEPHSSEFGVCRNYLDWLSIIPWGIFSKENQDLEKAKKILDEDHYGLTDVKERILEFMSVQMLSKKSSGNILCFVGPPGVGKTSLGKSIAKALGRPFYRFSVGGMRDEAEIKGHRRTYIGAMPGKLIQALKSCQVMNPVILLDEIDKIGHGHHGDPASALLEVLDPEQNRHFLDHYLDVGCDLSSVLFITTANVLDTIPEPLKDRMDILRLPGYIQQEKREIALRHLIPTHRDAMGLSGKWIRFNKEAVDTLIEGYAREAGVRRLEQLLQKILRKVAHQVVQTQQKNGTVKLRSIGKKDLIPLVGTPPHQKERFYEATPIGVCTGLAWTAMGGATLYIEAVHLAGEKLEMKLTGNAGQVMRESAEIAWSFIRQAFLRYAPGRPFFDKGLIHLHVPEGATPKDGPSAGITMATALLSLLLQKEAKQDLGMTGELTLTGHVLAIGGVREKVVAAKRTGLKTLILPKANERDWEELPDYLKEGLNLHLVDHYDQVLAHVFGIL